MYGIVHGGPCVVFICDTHGTSLGQSCERHEYCGYTLSQNDVLQFSWEGGSGSQQLVARRMELGSPSCCVGRVPLEHVGIRGCNYFDGKYAQVTNVFMDPMQGCKIPWSA